MPSRCAQWAVAGTLAGLLPHRVTQPVPHGTAGSIYARYPLPGRPAAGPATAARCSARLDLPSGQSVELACVHAAPPKPPWSPGATARWRSQLAALPAPGDGPCILAGDFNATLDHAQFRQLLRRGQAAISALAALRDQRTPGAAHTAAVMVGSLVTEVYNRCDAGQGDLHAALRGGIAAMPVRRGARGARSLGPGSADGSQSVAGP